MKNLNKKFIGIAFVGMSRFDGQQTIVVFNKIDDNSDNDKTGSMVQSWILNHDVKPNALVKAMSDSTVCGSCPMQSGNGCYVVVFQAPLSVWKAFHRGRYAIVGKDISEDDAIEILNNKKLRFGSYGNPSAANFVPWNKLQSVSSTNTGYDHDWLTADQSLAQSLMASVHTVEDMEKANGMGWRTFRVISEVNEIADNEILCPASDEAGNKTSCEKCSLCSGSKSNSKKNIAIVAHGSGKKKAIAAAFKGIAVTVA